MEKTEYYGLDIAEEFNDGTVRDCWTISWNVGNDGQQHFFLSPVDFSEVPNTKEHHVGMYYVDKYGRVFGRTIKLEKYIGESVQTLINCDTDVPKPVWEYTGVFLRPWTKMVTTMNEKGVRYHNWPEENNEY